MVEILDFRLIDPDGAPGFGYASPRLIGKHRRVSAIRPTYSDHAERYGQAVTLEGDDAYVYASTWLRPLSTLKTLVERYREGGL